LVWKYTIWQPCPLPSIDATKRAWNGPETGMKWAWAPTPIAQRKRALRQFVYQHCVYDWPMPTNLLA
jgi:hypothetical protein